MNHTLSALIILVMVVIITGAVTFSSDHANAKIKQSCIGDGSHNNVCFNYSSPQSNIFCSNNSQSNTIFCSNNNVTTENSNASQSQPISRAAASTINTSVNTATTSTATMTLPARTLPSQSDTMTFSLLLNTPTTLSIPGVGKAMAMATQPSGSCPSRSYPVSSNIGLVCLTIDWSTLT